MVKEESGELLEGATPVIDTTLYKPPELSDTALNNTTIFIDPSNPFSEAVQAKLLRKTDISTYKNVQVSGDNMPKYKVGSKIDLDDLTLKIVSKIGQGGFASTYKAVVTDVRCSRNSTTVGNSSLQGSVNTACAYTKSSTVCVKIQKPACPWELYICKELRERMSCMDSDIERALFARVMHVSHAAFFTDGSLMVNDLVPFGSLLNLVNIIKSKRKNEKLPEALVMYITIELLHTVEVLHRCKIIHGDIKPDNVLFMGFPVFDEKAPFNNTSIKLIDYGRGIDMSKFPNGTTFTANNETEGFMCIEMKTQRPWTYQTDLFGLIGTVYPLITFTYMAVNYDNGRWAPPSLRLPRGYQSKLWARMIDEFLNIPSCDEIPDVSEWRHMFECEFMAMCDVYNSCSTKVNAIVGITGSTK